MRQPYLVVGTLLVGLFVGAGAVMAQEGPGRLPGSVLGSQGTLGEKDQATVNGYVDYWVKELQSDDPERVAAARNRLIEPYSQGGTEAFVNQYDQIVANKLGAAMQSKHIFGRMNTLIVAQKVRHEKVADIIKAGLKEEVAAVAYPAAVAAEAWARNKSANLAVKLGLVKPLIEAMKKQGSGYVLEYHYRALIEIEDFNGWEAVMARMNERVAEFVADPAIGFDAELEGGRLLQVKVITVKASEAQSGVKLPEKTIHLFLLTNVRFMELALRQPSASRSATLATLLAIADQGAQWAAGALNAAGAKITVPPSMKNKSDDEAKLFLGDWKNLLKAEPLKFADAQITVPKPKAP